MKATSAQTETSGEKKTDSPAVKPKTWVRRLAKILFRASVSVVVLIFFAQLIWRFSGSNRWELIQEKDGIKIYTLKAPGADLLQFRAIGRIRSTLPGVVAWMADPDACIIQGCSESIELGRVGEQIQYNYFQYGQRDFVIEVYLYQNPDTKQVVVNVSAAPDKAPPRDGYFRITNLNNKWRITPLENGMVEVEIENNMDPGGFVPNFLYNMKRPDGMYEILTNLESWVSPDKYQNAKFEFIKEKNSAPPTQASTAR